MGRGEVVMADNVTSIAAKAPETIDVVMQWIKAMRQHGYFGESHAKNMVAALKNLSSILAPDEPRDVQWFLANLDTIVRRWVAKTTPNPTTAETHKSKAHAALQSFLEYQQDPTKFTPHTRTAGASKQQVSSQSPVKREKESQPAVAVKKVAQQENSAATESLQSLPLGEGKAAFEFRRLSNLKMRDVAKIACHLATLAEDFDPTNPSQARIYGIVAPEEPVSR
jgi:hypothetical protein